MYHVPPDTFKAFIAGKGLAEGFIPTPSTVPCIIEFHRGGVILGKVEVSCIQEFKAIIKHGWTLKGIPKNKYWIRGEEWETDANGNPIQELKI